MKFGEYLIGNKYVGSEHVDEAIRVQSVCFKKIGRILMELGFIDKKHLDTSLTEFFKLYSPQPNLDQSRPEKIDPSFVKKWGLEWVGENQNSIVVSGFRVDDSILQQLEKVYHRDVVFQHHGQYEGEASTGNELSLATKLSPDDLLMEKEVYSNFIRFCLESATKNKASDLHFEPFTDHYIVRMRVLGTLKQLTTIEPRFSEPLTIKIKQMVNMDIAQVIEPQDSQASFSDLGVAVRASSVPVAGGGEKIVLRLLYPDQTPTLSQLGLEVEQERFLRRMIRGENGLILVSGPTGSGKTTTLYSLLGEMDKEGKNISTLENPVEKELPGISQLNIINVADFPKFQRALMRQDPDIILLGEIRDQETAELGIKLANSGHLVLSTIHANGAVEALDRLIQLGVSEDSMRDVMRASIAQRLVKIQCECSRPKSDNHFSDLNRLTEEQKKPCSVCQNGVKARKPIIEYVEFFTDGPKKLSDLSLSFPLSQQITQLVKNGLISSEYLNHQGE